MKTLKQITLLGLLAAGLPGFSATLPTTIIGGGSDFLEIDDVSDPSTVTVNAGSENNYAGITGGTITYNYTSNTKEDKVVFKINDNFTINSKIVAVFDEPASFDLRNLLTFNIASGKTLTLNDFVVDYASNTSNNYIMFSGGRVVLKASESNPYTSLFHLNGTTFENNGNLVTGFTKLNSGVLNLGGNYKIAGNAYIGSGSGSTINLNGYNFHISSGFYFEQTDLVLTVSFGDKAENGGMVVYAVGSLQQQFASSTTIFKDFDYTEDLVLFKTPVSDLSIFEFEGYEGQEILSKVLTAEDTIDLQIDSSYAGYTSYYVIPEPSIFAAFFGIAALALIVLKRRK